MMFMSERLNITVHPDWHSVVKRGALNISAAVAIRSNQCQINFHQQGLGL